MERLKKITDFIRYDGIHRGAITRDPRYVIIGTVGLITLILSTIQAYDFGTLDSIEKPIFDLVNNWPSYLLATFFVITQFGSFVAIAFWAVMGSLLGKLRLAVTVTLSGLTAWLAAKIMKAMIGRGRPSEILESIQNLSNETFNGNGFPSGHSALAAACVFVLYFHVDRKYRKYLLLIVGLVGLSRIYLGAHFPLDVVGGWALGAVIAAGYALAIGTRRPPVPYAKLKKILKSFGHSISSVRQLNVDARGSIPLIAESKEGQQYFIKVFGKQEHAADWLYKSMRFIKYQSPVNEKAYLSSKENMQIESLGSLWAQNAGVRTPKTLLLFQLDGRWVLVQERLNAKPLSSYKQINRKVLEDIWKQVGKMHNANMAHRDLRAENIMVDTNRQAYIIDFGFSEISPKKARIYIDIAQLLMSLSLISSTMTVVDAAKKYIPKKTLVSTVPYLQKDVFSAAILEKLHEQPDKLNEVRKELKKSFDVQSTEKVNLRRLNIKKLLWVLAIAALFYVIIPQFNEFKGALTTLSELNWSWALLVVVASFVTYVAAGLVISSLSKVPLRLYRVVLVQFASSFVSKIAPGGIGSASLNLQFLRKSGAGVGEASSVIAGERIVGFLGLATLIAIFSITHDISATSMTNFSLKPWHGVLAAGIMVFIYIALRLKPQWKYKIKRTAKESIDHVRSLCDTPTILFQAFAAGLGITLAYIASLYFSLLAVGGSLGLLQILLVYISAMAAKSVSPTPGGLGALEVAMAASLQAFGIDGSTAYATVVVYRLATYWLPLPFGLLAYRYISGKNYI